MSENIDTHYSTTILCRVGEIDLFVSQDEGIQIGVSRGTQQGTTASIADMTLHQARQLHSALSESIRLQLIYEGKSVLIQSKHSKGA